MHYPLPNINFLFKFKLDIENVQVQSEFATCVQLQNNWRANSRSQQQTNYARICNTILHEVAYIFLTRADTSYIHYYYTL